jgi:hypothetical protein
VRLFTYAGAGFLLVWMGWAVYVVVTHDRHPGIDIEQTCKSADFSCSAVAGIAGPLFSLALASAAFLVFRLRRVRGPYVRTARKRPRDSVPTAGRILDEVVGRDELCNVIIADLLHRATRRPHVVVGGVGTGKTAVLVRLTQLLAARGAVPIAVRLRDAQDAALDFRELARKRFLAQTDRTLLSDEEGARVWRHLLKNDRIVVLADGLEEALIEGNAHSDRDNLICLALQQASRERLPLVVASRPHDPLRGMDAAIVELEPLSQAAAMQYIQRQEASAEERRLEWVVETAEVSETPLYLQITRELHRMGLLEYVSRNPDGRRFDTRRVDRAELRLRLLQQWRWAVERGDFLPEVPLTPAQRAATVLYLSVLACIGLRQDRLEVRLDDLDELFTRRRNGQPIPLIDELSRRLTGRDQPGETLRHEIRLAATRGMDLELVEARGESVRFQHSIVQSYLGAEFIDAAMKDPEYRKAALDHPGRELLIALVLHSRASRQQAGPPPVAAAALPSSVPHRQPDMSRAGWSYRFVPRRAAEPPLAAVLRDATRGRHDVKALDLLAASLQVDAVDKRLEHDRIAEQILQQWVTIEGDPRTLEEAKLNLVHRYGDAMRIIAERQRHEELATRPAYLQLFQLACREPEYSVRLAAAQEIGAGGDEAFDALRDRLAPPGAEELEHRRRLAAPLHLGPDAPARTDEREADERRHREHVIRAWLAPLLLGSVRDRERAARDCLDAWLGYVRSEAARRDEAGTGLSLEVALALGFKYAANRRRRHLHTREEARAHLVERATEMLRASEFWFTRIILIQALCLWRMPDPPDARNPRHQPDFRSIVRQWGASPTHRVEHPFVVETRRLAIRALETGQPERYMWIDESGIVSQIGSGASDYGAQRHHNLWIPPSAGWTALHPRTQQLVADVLLLLNLAERGRPAERERRLYRTRPPTLPPCLTADRSPLDPARIVASARCEPGSNCAPGCVFELCPYPSRGQQHYRHELSEAFCRRQQALVRRSALGSHSAPWQDAVPADLRLFWKQMGQPTPRRDGNREAFRRTRSR